jgi:hypothetical protein
LCSSRTCLVQPRRAARETAGKGCSQLAIADHSRRVDAGMATVHRKWPIGEPQPAIASCPRLLTADHSYHHTSVERRSRARELGDSMTPVCARSRAVPWQGRVRAEQGGARIQSVWW